MRLLSVALLFVLAVTSPAWAQEQTEAQRRAAARALFAEGVTFAHDEQWPEAADRFRRTMDLHPTPVVAFNLAAALVELGRLVEAAEHLRMTQRFPGAEEEVRREAEAMLAQIEPRIAHLRIDADALPRGAHVEADGRVLTRAELGVELPTDPGTHRFLVVLEGATVEERTMELGPGQHERIALGADLSPSAAAATVDDGASRDPLGGTDDSGGDVAEEWWFWTIIAVLVVGAGVGIGVGVAVSQPGDADPIPGNLDPPVLRGMVFP